jgi:1-phosphofructokinase/tagatose 6-phosphate kinase
MVKKAKENGLFVVIDVKKQELINSLEFHPDVIKPNLSEFVETFFDDVRITENEDSEYLKGRVMAKARELYKNYGVKTVLSRGRFDTWAFDGEKEITVPSINVPVVNTIGCGDSMTAGFVDAVLDGKSFSDAIQFGMQCAVQRASHLLHGL